MYLFFCFKISFNILNFFFILLYISENSLFPYFLLNFPSQLHYPQYIQVLIFIITLL